MIYKKNWQTWRILILFSSLYLGACNQPKITQKKDSVILKLGEKPIYASEFKYLYEKNINNRDSLYEKSSVENYLDLFVAYKLKVSEAINQGIDTTDNFQREHETYKDILAKPYLIDPQKLEQLSREAYQRLQAEVRVSHVLLRVAQEANPADTLKVYQQMKEIQQKARNGADFASLAQEFSQDPSVANNGGDLGYFTALQMVYPFESQAYQTPVGEISDVFRTPYGYHILQVEDRRPNRGITQIAHIMVQLPQEAENETTEKAKRRIEEVYQQLQQGKNWETLCIKYSDDSTSKYQGGKLPEFNVGEVIPSIEQAAYQLKRVGEYSQPTRTPYGWHIFKLISRKPIPAYEEMETSIKQQVSKDQRYQSAKLVLLSRLRDEYNLRENTEVYQKAINYIDKRLPQATWSIPNETGLDEEILFTLNSKNIGQKAYSLRDFFKFIFRSQTEKPALTNLEYITQLYYKDFLEKSLLDFEQENLPYKYPDYVRLVNEYREGSMLFQMMTEEVWEKAIQDTTGSKAFFKKNRQNYRWNQRATADIYVLRNKETLNQLKTYLAKNIYPVANLQIDNLYFDKNDQTLSEESVKSIKQAAQILKADQELVLEVIGHADPAENKDMAEKRIDPVVKYLGFEGVPSNRIIIKDFGFTRPISKDDRGKNRRVEFKIYTRDKKQLEKIFPASAEVLSGTFEKGDNSYLDQLNWAPGSYTLDGKDQKIVYIEINDIKEPRLKEYDEARGYVITDYQKYLEEKWLAELRQKYPVEINQTVVQELIRQ